jgi:glycolate dehydrogenase FAD-binding subunit
MKSAEEFIPKSQKELCEFLEANSEGLKKTVYPSGNGGPVPDSFHAGSEGIVINLSEMNQLIDFPYNDMTITVQAGISFEKFSEMVTEKNLNLPIDITEPDQSSLGGIFATNPIGSHIFGRGTLRDYVIGITAVTSDGKLFHSGGRVVKNVAGYDLCKMLLGSFGTLAIITEITFKLTPIPESTRAVCLHFSNHEEIESYLTLLNTSSVRPVICDLFNKKAIIKINHELQKTSSVAISDDHPFALVLGFEGFSKEVDWYVEQVTKDFCDTKHSKIETFDETDSKLLINTICRFPELTSGNISIQANTLPSAVSRLTEIFNEQGYTVQTHAGNGVVKGFQLCQEIQIDQISHQLEEINKLVQANKGYLIIPESPPELQEKLSIWGDPQPNWSIMKKLKNKLDPDDLLYSKDFHPVS